MTAEDVRNARTFLEDVLEQLQDDMPQDVEYIDVRVQYVDGGFEFHSGDAQYDTDHRGGWATGSVSRNDYAADMAQLAHDLVMDALADAADRDED